MPSAGVTQITSWREDPGDHFRFTGAVSDPLVPAGARTTSVTNRSTNIDTRGVLLDEVTHTDAVGGNITESIGFNVGHGEYRGLLVSGPWTIHAANLSAVLLDEGRHLRLDIAWVR